MTPPTKNTGSLDEVHPGKERDNVIYIPGFAKQVFERPPVRPRTVRPFTRQLRKTVAHYGGVWGFAAIVFGSFIIVTGLLFLALLLAYALSPEVPK